MATKKKIAKAKKAAPKKAAKPAGKKNVKSSSKKKPAKAIKKVVVKKPVAKKVAKKVVAKKAKPVAKKKVAAKPVAKSTIAKTKKVEVKAVVKKPNVAKTTPSAPVYFKPVSPPAATRSVMQEVLPPVTKPFIKLPTPKTMTTVTQKNSNGSNKTRYADAELKEFKDLIIGKLTDARAELVNLNAAIISANENGTDDTGSSFKMLEDGSDTLAKEEAAQLASRQKKFIEQLEAALVRIENKTYGICRVTGKLIPKERLRAVPHTTQSMEAKLNQYKD